MHVLYAKGNEIMNLDYLRLEKEVLFNWFEGLISKSIEALEGKALNDGKLDYYKQEFFKQYYTHFLSIRTLTPGLRLRYKNRENEISALASISVLIRASIENFSMFHHIYRESNDPQDTYFKFWSWFREGLISRQRLTVKHYPEKLKVEKEEIDRILNEVREYPLYQALTKKQKDKYRSEGAWCFSSKRTLLESAGFSKPLANNCYNFFSSYAHPTSGSHLQTAQADFETSNGILLSMLKPLFICTGLYLHNYSLMFKEVTGLLNEKDREFVGTWCEFGSELMKDFI